MKKFPQYHFCTYSRFEFEITTMQTIFKRSKNDLIYPHRQLFFGITYFTQSHGAHVIDFQSYPIQKHCISTISEEQVHYFDDPEQMEGKVLLFTRAFLNNDELLEQIFGYNADRPHRPVDDDRREEFEALLHMMYGVYFSARPFREEMLRNYLRILLLMLLQSPKQAVAEKDISFQRYLRFKKDLSQHFQHHKEVAFYADLQAITPKTLNLAVRKCVDKSAKQFISEYLTLLAKRMLVSQKYASTEVAHELGFEEPTNFSKFFKKIEQISPSHFQELHRSL